MDPVKVIEIKKSVFEDNGRDADRLRAELKEKKLFLLNLMSSPGSGKTSTLIRTINLLKDKLRIAVMEADIDSDVDAVKIREATGVESIQLHTGGMCHLDAEMTRQGLENLPAGTVDLAILENVGNLKTFDDGKTYQFIKNSLRAAGYPCIIDAVLNSKDYSGIAQFRNRIYIVAFKKPDDCRSFRNIYGDGLEKRDMDERFAQIVTDGPVPLKYYYSKDDPNKCISIRYEEHFVPAVTEHGVFYQYRRTKMRRNQNGLCPALTASMGGGGHNVPIILDDYGIRKLTPRECLNVQGFPKWYEFPEDMVDGHKYKQAGNSVSVPVIHSFADIIHHALEDADKSKQ